MTPKNKNYKPISEEEYLERAVIKLLNISEEFKPYFPSKYFQKFQELIKKRKFKKLSETLTTLERKGSCDTNCQRSLIAKKMIETARIAELSQPLKVTQRRQIKSQRKKPNGPREKNYITSQTENIKKTKNDMTPRFMNNEEDYCKTGFIINPVTGRCVLEDGRIGKTLV